MLKEGLCFNYVTLRYAGKRLAVGGGQPRFEERRQKLIKKREGSSSRSCRLEVANYGILREFVEVCVCGTQSQVSFTQVLTKFQKLFYLCITHLLEPKIQIPSHSLTISTFYHLPSTIYHLPLLHPPP